MIPRVAVLDDYQNVALANGDWGRLGGRAEVTVFHDHLFAADELVAQLAPFSAVVLMRERTPSEHPLRRLANPVLTPHIGYVSRESYAIYYAQLADDVAAWLDGAPVRRILSTVVPDKLAYEVKR
jgi:phosphoglycerate dehydrogenase-like enzyme